MSDTSGMTLAILALICALGAAEAIGHVGTPRYIGAAVAVIALVLIVVSLVG